MVEKERAKYTTLFHSTHERTTRRLDAFNEQSSVATITKRSAFFFPYYHKEMIDWFRCNDCTPIDGFEM